ncbi:MAG: TenA family protein, partial [Synergistaceae bacterium]|nr:TenA family protein [Synergistaceae bacterium]
MSAALRERLFSAEVFEELQPVLQRIFEHPFNQDLRKGVLSRERFCFYMQQDSLYLVHFARALALTGSRLAQEKRIAALLAASHDALMVERSLHEHYFAEYGVNPDARESPVCMGYTSFLLATASLWSLNEALAALLPCYWVYREVGGRIARTAVFPNPYAKWIETYTDKNYSARVDRFIELVDDAAAEVTEQERLHMKDRFIT